LAGIILPWIELALGALLILGQWTTRAAEASIGLLLIFSIAIFINLLRGNRVECHCFGHLGIKQISWWSVARNLLLLIIAAQVTVGNSWSLAADGLWRGSLSGPADPPVSDFVPVVLIALAMVLFSVLSRSVWRVARVAVDAGDARGRGITDFTILR